MIKNCPLESTMAKFLGLSFGKLIVITSFFVNSDESIKKCSTSLCFSAVAVLTPKHPIERSAKQENMNVLIIVFITIKTAGGNEEE